MGVLFDGTGPQDLGGGLVEAGDYYTVADSEDLVLPGGSAAWAFGLWVNVADLAGASYQYALSQGPFGANSFHLYTIEASTGQGIGGTWVVELFDPSGRRMTMNTADFGADGLNRLVVVQDNGENGRKELWTVEAGGSATLQDSTTDTLDVVDGSGALNIGRRADGNEDRYFANTLGEFWKGNFALSELEMEALAAGQSIKDIGKAPDIWLPFVSAAPSISDAAGNGHTATRVGDPQTVAPHFIGTGSGSAVAAKAAYIQRMMQG